ncbi:MAG: S41 family peptidase [Bacteroidota bacterium]
MKKRFSLTTTAALVVVSIFAGMEINNLISADNIYEQIKKFGDVLSAAEKVYVDDVDTGKLTDAAIVGMLNTLDPHSVYIPPKQLEKVMEEFKGKFEGVGISFRVLNDTITVIEPVAGGPSARMGVLSNDRIVKINDTSSIKWTDQMVMHTLRGPKGTRVKISIVRPSVKEILEFVIIRDEIALTSVDAALMLTKDVGYIKVNQFKETTHTEMEKALQTLKTKGMSKLILDLRDNGGGYLEEAVRMADQFLDGGPVDKPHRIVYTKSRKPEFEESYTAKTGDAYEKIPLIILIDNATASASEIVAGAIQDWDRGLIVGETSFGKGLVQRQIELADKSAIRLTIARYYTPSGRLIQRSYQGKDKDEYQLEAFQRDEQEGDNLEHKHDTKSAKESPGDGQEGDSLKHKQIVSLDTTIPVFKTGEGRTVLGGGGITPDYIVKSERVTGLILTIYRKNLFYDFIKNYMEGQGYSLRGKYDKNYEEYKLKYFIPDEVMKEFRKFVETKEIKIDEKEYAKDIDFLKARLKAEIARMIYGTEGEIGILVGVDNQIQKALTLFPEAEHIAKLK